MTTAQRVDTDLSLNGAVARQLEWDPQVDASAIGLAVHDGVVTLTGYVDTYAEKLAAERAVKRAAGVRAVANELAVRPAVGRTDVDIATDVAHALRSRSTVPAGVQAVVHEGHVTLTGRVNRLFEKESAAKAVRYIRGVRQVHNYIAVTPQPTDREVQRAITTALHENADVDAHHIRVIVVGETATLTGRVGSWLQREAAERAAAAAPGIVHVDNQIAVGPSVDIDGDPLC